MLTQSSHPRPTVVYIYPNRVAVENTLKLLYLHGLTSFWDGITHAFIIYIVLVQLHNLSDLLGVNILVVLV